MQFDNAISVALDHAACATEAPGKALKKEIGAIRLWSARLQVARLGGGREVWEVEGNGAKKEREMTEERRTGKKANLLITEMQFCR